MGFPGGSVTVLGQMWLPKESHRPLMYPDCRNFLCAQSAVNDNIIYLSFNQLLFLNFSSSVAGELGFPLEAACMLVDSRLINHNLITNLESWNKKLW